MKLQVKIDTNGEQVTIDANGEQVTIDTNAEKAGRQATNLAQADNGIQADRAETPGV
jgi:hypothetical protein